MKTFHRIMLYAVAVLCLGGVLSMAVLTAADTPTPLTAEEVAQAAEAAITLQQAQLDALRAQQRLQEMANTYRAFVTEMQAKHDAAGCNLTARQQWSCPQPPTAKEEPNAPGPGTGSGGAGTDQN